MRFFTLWVSLAVLLITGCSIKEYDRSDPKVITIKMPGLRYNDMGFIRSRGDAVQAELFTAGQAIERFEIDGMVCVKSKGCLTKGAFNEKYLHASYPADLLKKVFLGQPVYAGKNLVSRNKGFEQRITDAYVDITYRVDASVIMFKDRRQQVLIKLKSTNTRTKDTNEQ
jgi:hypothetical protein